ncbi:MAG: energy transducer TonB [Desulfuromonadaceae bacterium]|nr:energy transducer TonB [Desulfuromonadaceae bacterium]
MRSEGRSILASLFLHLAFLGCAAGFIASPPKPQAPILIDFTMAQGQHAERREMKGVSNTSPPHVTPLPPSPQNILPAATASPEIPAVPAKAVSETTPPPFTTAAVSATAAAPGGVATAEPGKTGNGGQSASSGAGEKSPGTGNALRGDSVESRQTRYLKEHFSYIRDAIAGNLQYPGKARKMGWTGKLAIEFVILESGTVDRIRITKSSGIPLLDSDAEETVRRSAPFPKPPVSARLVIPLEYVLR